MYNGFMKLVLGSNGAFLAEVGYDLLGMPMSELRVLYVNTASKAVKSLAYLERHREAMRAKGIYFEEVDIEGKTVDELERVVADKNVIHVEGGNTFYLLRAVRATGFDGVIKRAIERGVAYVGTSAGAYIACPTIVVATWNPEMDRCGLVTPDELVGLNLVPFVIKAHYTEEKREQVTTNRGSLAYPLRILRDGQGIFVTDTEVRFVGVGNEIII
jgi:dipeptidase E